MFLDCCAFTLKKSEQEVFIKCVCEKLPANDAPGPLCIEKVIQFSFVRQRKETAREKADTRKTKGAFSFLFFLTRAV